MRRASRRARCATAIITCSTARKPSFPAEACPTFMSAWCGPGRRARTAFPASPWRRERRACPSARRKKSSDGNRSRPRWSSSRIAEFRSRLADFQALQFRIADHATELEAARLMVRRAAVAVGNREEGATRLAAMAKRFATDIGFEAVNGCLQLHGGYGYLRDHPIERVLRDLRVHQILEGTNEVMRLIVSRDLLGN